MITTNAKLKFLIISGKPKNLFEIELHNKAFQFWKLNWEETYKGKLNNDEFFRQDTVAMLMSDDQVVALHLYTSFDTSLDSHREHSYIKAYSEKFLSELKNKKLEIITSAEYMTVDKKYRNSPDNIARLLLYLSLKTFRYHGKEVMIAPADIKQGVSHIVQEAGAVIVDSNVLYKGFLVDLGFILPFSSSRPPEKINAMVSLLWNNRIDYSNWSEVDRPASRQAA